jgi:hypothetical protein
MVSFDSNHNMKLNKEELVKVLQMLDVWFLPVSSVYTHVVTKWIKLEVGTSCDDETWFVPSNQSVYTKGLVVFRLSHRLV